MSTEMKSSLQGGNETERLIQVNYQDWSPVMLGNFIAQKGFGEYRPVFIKNKVDGSIVHLLGPEELKEMGIDKIGDRLKLQQILGTLQRATIRKQRERIIWTGKEDLYNSRCSENILTCCGCNVMDPSFYSLSNTHLKLKSYDYWRCGPIILCCGHSYGIDHIDLSYINDIDVEGEPPSCFDCFCCGHTQETVHLTSRQGNKSLTMREGEGQELVKLLQTQIDVIERMERR